MWRDHRDPDVVRLMEAWDAEIAAHSRRDQLSLGYLIWRLGIRPQVLPRSIGNARANVLSLTLPHRPASGERPASRTSRGGDCRSQASHRLPLRSPVSARRAARRSATFQLAEIVRTHLGEAWEVDASDCLDHRDAVIVIGKSRASTITDYEHAEAGAGKHRRHCGFRRCPAADGPVRLHRHPLGLVDRRLPGDRSPAIRASRSISSPTMPTSASPGASQPRRIRSPISASPATRRHPRDRCRDRRGAGQYPARRRRLAPAHRRPMRSTMRSAHCSTAPATSLSPRASSLPAAAPTCWSSAASATRVYYLGDDYPFSSPTIARPRSSPASSMPGSRSAARYWRAGLEVDAPGRGAVDAAIMWHARSRSHSAASAEGHGPARCGIAPCHRAFTGLAPATHAVPQHEP